MDKNHREHGQELIETNDINMQEDEKNTSEEQLTSNELIQKLEIDINELKDKLLRSTAEIENTRKRYEKMIQEARDYSITSFANDLIGVMDNLYRALDHKPVENDSPEVKNFITGVDMISNELKNSFAKYGIVRILPQVGDKFDYNLHQAVSQIPTNDFEPGMIVSVMQAGYQIKDRLLRPAMVTVSITKEE